MGLTVFCRRLFMNLYREFFPKFYLYDTFCSVGHKRITKCFMLGQILRH